MVEEKRGREEKMVMRMRIGYGGGNARHSSHANWLQWITF